MILHLCLLPDRFSRRNTFTRTPQRQSTWTDKKLKMMEIAANSPFLHLTSQNRFHIIVYLRQNQPTDCRETTSTHLKVDLIVAASRVRKIDSSTLRCVRCVVCVGIDSQFKSIDFSLVVFVRFTFKLLILYSNARVECAARQFNIQLDASRHRLVNIH